jgi:hypothetical protein
MPRPRLAHAGALLLATFAALSLAACGKRGNPLPPIRLIPANTTDLTLLQRGNELTLDFAYPTATVAGTALPPLQSIEVFEVRQPVVLGKPLPTLTPRDFTGLAQSILTLRGPELANATSGDRLSVRIQMAGPLPSVPTAPPTAPTATPPTPTPAATPETAAAATAAEPAPSPAETASTPAGPKIELCTYAVKLTPEGGEPSAFSNLARLIPRQPPAPPAGVAVAATADGIELTWQAASPADAIQSYLVYRRPAVSRGWGKPIGSPAATATAYEDKTATYGQRYIYALSAAAQKDPLIESALSAEREISYEDRFAPPTPTGLVALGESGQARLRWEPSAATDVKGYLLYRRDPGGDWRAINEEAIPGVEFRDVGLVSGLTYEYRLLAVDQVGNQGAPCEPVSVLVR